MSKKVLVPIASGSEEMEAVVIIDLLRRSGCLVIVAGESELITCSRGVKIVPDKLIDQIDENEEFDAIVLPGGGPGTERLSENEHLNNLLKNHSENNKLTGAICAAPTILHKNNLLKESDKITSHPGVKLQLIKYVYTENTVETSRHFFTSRGAGTTIQFSLKIIEKLYDKEKADKIAAEIVYKGEY